MKRNSLIKTTLFTLATIVSLRAQSAQSGNELTLLEDLPVAQRAIVHKAVLEFLAANPDLASSVKIIAIDNEGNVYVLDENKITLSVLGQPSCVSM